MGDVSRLSIHALVDQLMPEQLPAVETALRELVDSVARALASAPPDDEPYTDEDRAAVAEAEESLKTNPPISLEDVLADLGVSPEKWKADLIAERR
jgi:hypothetical protein